jgi:hypothetical protein
MRSDLVASSFFAFLSPFAVFLAAMCFLPSLEFTAQFPDLLPPGECLGGFQLLGFLESLRALARFLGGHVFLLFSLNLPWGNQLTLKRMRVMACFGPVRLRRIRGAQWPSIP